MRILFTRFPLESALGGAERQTLSLMQGLSGRGFDVAFLGSCPVLLEETARLKILHAALKIGPPPVTKFGAVSFAWRRKKMRRRLLSALSAFPRPDAVCMLSLSEKLLLTETAVQQGIKVFWIEHDRIGPWLKQNPWLPTLRKLSESVMTICVSELSRNIYLNLGWSPEKTVAIPNGIDLSRFSSTPPPPLSPSVGGERGLRLGCVARLSREKGVDVLIQAVSGLSTVDLTIIGRGPEENYLRQMIGSIHAAEMTDHERIKIVHHVDNLAAFYRSIDALVLPSRDNDPFGLVAAEAMACGTPVIVTDQCGIAGYLRDGHDAVLCRADSEEALREAILRASDRSLLEQLAGNGTETARNVFSRESMIDAYARLLR